MFLQLRLCANRWWGTFSAPEQCRYVPLLKTWNIPMSGFWMLRDFFSSLMPCCPVLPGSVFLLLLLLFWTAAAPIAYGPLAETEETELSAWVFTTSIMGRKRLFLLSLSHQTGVFCWLCLIRQDLGLNAPLVWPNMVILMVLCDWQWSIPFLQAWVVLKTRDLYFSCQYRCE